MTVWWKENLATAMETVSRDQSKVHIGHSVSPLF